MPKSIVEDRYLKIYSYIIGSKEVKSLVKEFLGENTTNDSLLNIIVSDTIYIIPLYSSTNDAINYEYADKSNDEKRHIKDSLFHAGNKISEQSVYDDRINSIPKPKNPRFILFYINPQKNKIEALLYPVKGDERSLQKTCGFTQAIAFLFYFDTREEIVKVFTNKVFDD